MADQIIPDIIKLATVACDAIMEIYRQETHLVHMKENKTPVTEADMVSHAILVSGLKRLQNYPVLSEEESALPFEERQRWKRYWLVDPLDGTREFIKRTGEFSINIALIDGHQPVFGLIFSPVTMNCYYALQGKGAFIKNPDQEERKIHTDQWQIDRPFRLLGSRHHDGTLLAGFLDHFPSVDAKKMGSALKFGKIAAAEADFYPRLGPTSEWDTAAGQCILEEAGGAVLDLQGNPLMYNMKDSLLNPHFVAVGDLKMYLALRG